MECAKACKPQILSQRQWQIGECDSRNSVKVKAKFRVINVYQHQPWSAHAAAVTSQLSRLPSGCRASGEASGRATEAEVVLQTCKQCLQQFDPADNGPAACRQVQPLVVCSMMCWLNLPYGCARTMQKLSLHSALGDLIFFSLKPSQPPHFSSCNHRTCIGHSNVFMTSVFSSYLCPIMTY